MADNMDDNDIKAYLFGIGFDPEEVELMSLSDRRELVRSLTEEDANNAPSMASNSAMASSNSAMPTSSRLRFEDEDDAMQTDEHSHDQMLQSFCEVTGADINTATQMLEACSWNMETAITMHMDSEAPAPPVQSSRPPVTLPSRGAGPDDLLSHPMMRQFIDPSAFLNAMQGSGGFGYGGGFDDDEQPAPRAPEYDEHGVRRPDPVRVSRLIGGHDHNSDFSRADDPTVEWMFPPPRHLSFPGTFQDARALAKQDKKWILVNIQTHTEFDSHKLNRDTWADETVVEILREHFVFWQRGHTSQDARSYMGLYHVSESELPHIAILDPRTGAKNTTMRGYVEPRLLTQSLFEFLDENSFESMKAGRERVHRSAAASEPVYIDDDDETDYVAVSDFKQEEDTREAKKPREESIPRVDYGPVSVEPAEGIRVSIKLASGKALVRRYNASDPVRQLFAVARDSESEAKEGRTFELSTTFPKVGLSSRIDETLATAGLANSSVIMQWV